MAIIAPAFVRVEPSFVEPGLILSYSQASQAYDLLHGGGPTPRLAEDDLYVYMHRADIRTRAAAGQATYEQLPGVQITMSQISTPSYMQRIRVEWNHHDAAAAGRWNMPIAEAYRLGMWQGHYQLGRNALLYGYNPANGEGLLNTNGATSMVLPADTNGNQTLVTYDNGQLAFLFLQILAAIKTRTNQFGIGNKFSIVGPQRVLGQMEMVNIVQLVQFQRTGAGSVTTAELVNIVASANGNQIEWGYDDSLIGKGPNGTDVVVFAMTEVHTPKAAKWNTNIWATIKPGLEACTMMYCDRSAPTEIPTPLPGGGTDVVSEFRITPGWGIRPEAIEILYMVYQ
jgi:hypothetical protein